MYKFSKQVTLCALFLSATAATAQEFEGARPLTSGEINLVQSFFGPDLDTNPVRIVNAQDAHLLPIKDYLATAINNTILFHDQNFQSDDFSKEPEKIPLFMHEMTHISQFQNGVPVLWEGAKLHLSRHNVNPYAYEINEDSTFDGYQIEQQANIIGVYFELNNIVENEQGSLTYFNDISSITKFCTSYEQHENMVIQGGFTPLPPPQICHIISP